jgi:hypothetical protein
MMNEIYNVYCDESCHLEHDRQPAMVLGALWCPLRIVRSTAEELRKIKARHGLSPNFEVKWTKVSPAKADFYHEFLDFFFDEPELYFRALIVPDKSQLRHKEFGQDHDTWYFKMYFEMLQTVIGAEDRYRLYLDIKDTRSAAKVEKLHEVLANDLYDFSHNIVERVQIVRSHEIEQLQLADLLIGAVSYANRGLIGNTAKVALVERMRKRSGCHLTVTTYRSARKVNLLRWIPSGAGA